MAEALFNRRAEARGLNVRAASAGTAAGTEVQPIAVEVMAELGVRLTDQFPKLLTQPMADAASHIVTMGCGVDADACPARMLVSEDWGLDDPKARPIEEVRAIRDEIATRVESLLDRLEARE